MGKQGIWAQAANIADQTPESRNRYVDLLRAVSILSVVLGHWTMAAPYLTDGRPQLAHLLDISAWTRWITWLFQVMPVFFFVGGFSNGTSWDGAQRKGVPYRAWLELRLRRLLGPVIPLVLFWAALALVPAVTAVPWGMYRIASQIAIVPVWFLAIYLVIVMIVPISRSAWRRWGLWSFWLPVGLAALMDVAFFVGDLRGLGWFNYLFIWSAIHQLGYAWQDGTLKGMARRLPFLLMGLPGLVALTQLGPYPVSLVGVPSEEISNSLPPKLPLLALGLAQIGLLLSLEGPARRWLALKTPWTLTVLINGMIMTVFLWHSSVMMLLIGAGFWLLPVVHGAYPGTGEWWSYRPLWVAVYALATIPFVAAFTRFERRESKKPVQAIALWRLFSGALAIGLGLAALAKSGMGGQGAYSWVPVAMILVGSWLASLGPLSPAKSG